MKNIPVIFGILLSFGVHAQDSLQFRLYIYNSIWKNNAPRTALEYYAEYRSKGYKRDAFMMYSSGIAYCLTSEYEKGRTNLGLINNFFEGRDPRSPDEENKLLYSRVAHEKCVEECVINDFSKEFEPYFLTESDEREILASNTSVSPNSGRASVNTGLNNKIKSSWFPGNTFVVPIPTETTYSEDTIKLFENRLFVPFEKDILIERMDDEFLTQQMSLYKGTYFNIVSFVPHIDSNLFKSRMSFLEKSLSIFIRDFNFKLPLKPISIYIVNSKYQLDNLAEKLHFTNSNEFTIGYSFIYDQSIVAITPNFLLGTINHEIVHILSKYNHTNYPLWYEEGLASIYEVSAFVNNEHKKRTDLIGVHNWRGEWLEKFLFMSSNLERFAEDYHIARTAEDRKEVAINHKEALVKASEIVKARADSLVNESFFLGKVSDSDIDLYEQQINYAMARYYIMYHLYNETEGVDNRKTDGRLKLFTDYNDIPFDKRYFNHSKSDPLTFLLWYFSNYYRSEDKTYDSNLPFAKDRSSYE